MRIAYYSNNEELKMDVTGSRRVVGVVDNRWSGIDPIQKWSDKNPSFGNDKR
jgi:hypothetical protein